MSYLAAGACIVTLGILVAGISGFGSGKMTPRKQNKMMQWRIAAQFVAVILILLTVVLTGKG